MQENNIKECTVKATPAIEQMITRTTDAIERINAIRNGLVQRNDRLFGCVPSGVDGSKEDVPDGSINELHNNIEQIHYKLTLLDEEISRQEGLV